LTEVDRLGPDTLVIHGVKFVRRSVAGGTFRIQPIRPVEELRVEALRAVPPRQPDTLLAPDLVELKSLDPTIQYDIRYATTNNFMSAVFYSQPRAFLQRPAAEAVVRAHQKLKALGYGLLIHDAYRPWYVTKMFWDATPDSLRHFVADPSAGSRHNRGAAVDLTLYDLATGEPIEMPGGYDEFSPRSYPEYPGGTSRQRWHRELLRRVMEAEGFRVYDFEWWHFDYRDWRRYPVLNKRFEEL
jgi:D-alanyl-D-alanine dipeptidase